MQEMPWKSLRPSVICCSATIIACEKGIKWEAALELLQGLSQMERMEQKQEEESHFDNLIRVANLLSKTQIWDGATDCDIYWHVYHGVLR